MKNKYGPLLPPPACAKESGVVVGFGKVLKWRHAMGVVRCHLVSLGRATGVRDIDGGVYFLCVLLLLLGGSNCRRHRCRRERLLSMLMGSSKLCRVPQAAPFLHHEARCTLQPPQRGRGQGGLRQGVESIAVWSLSIPTAGVCYRCGAPNFCFCFVAQTRRVGRYIMYQGIQYWLGVFFI